MLEEIFQSVEWECIGAITEGVIWIRVNFEEETIGSRRRSGSRQYRDEVTFAAGNTFGAARGLDTMCGIEDE